jgi:ABC-type uncharacterized transport system permease subunit
MCFKEKGYFGFGELAGQYLIRAASLLAMLAVWRALFAQGLTQDGLSLSQMLTYTVLGGALGPMLNVRTPASSWLHDGTMLSLYLRPAGIFGQLAAHTVGGWLAPLLCFGAPVALAAALLGVRLTPASNWWIPSLALCVLQGFAVDFLFAALLMRLKNLEWVVHSLREALNALLTGALIPFAALPWGLGKALAMTPLGTLAGAPLSLFAGLEDPARILAAQLFWTAALWPLAYLAFTRSRERLVSYGG